MSVPALITYPARPIQGGRLELAPPKRGLWYAEPKLNGWRALIHTPTGTMGNRHGALLTIADCFRPALATLAKLASRGLVWADCEALERRHNLGRDTLVVLDVVPESGTPSYQRRRAMLESIIPIEPVFSGDTTRPVPCGALVLTPTFRADFTKLWRCDPREASASSVPHEELLSRPWLAFLRRGFDDGGRSVASSICGRHGRGMEEPRVGSDSKSFRSRRRR
jgi:hypothetical protein